MIRKVALVFLHLKEEAFGEGLRGVGGMTYCRKKKRGKEKRGKRFGVDEVFLGEIMAQTPRATKKR